MPEYVKPHFTFLSTNRKSRFPKPEVGLPRNPQPGFRQNLSNITYRRTYRREIDKSPVDHERRKMLGRRTGTREKVVPPAPAG
jgi:hypothetical protein